MRKLLLSVALATTATSSFVSAAPFSDIYVFGDSLFDTGNLGGRATNRVGPDYENSPFGPVSPDLVAAGLRLERATPSAEGDTNYAVGANRSLQTLDGFGYRPAQTRLGNRYAFHSLILQMGLKAA